MNPRETAERPGVFVSHTHADAVFVRVVYERLEAQGLAVWDYSEPSEAVLAGQALDEALRRQIERCRVFVVVVTPASLASPWVAFEIEHAFMVRRRSPTLPLFIVPLVDAAVLGVPWPDAFEPLKKQRYACFEARTRYAIGEAICDICALLGRGYRPPPVVDPRLPFADRLYAEIDDRVPRESASQVSLYRRLVRLVEAFLHAFTTDDFAEANVLSGHILSTCEVAFGEPFYYVLLVHALCRVQLGDLAGATALLDRVPPDAPQRDETLEGLRGHIAHRRGDLAGAIAHFERAVEADPDDPQAWLNLLRCRVDASGDAHDLEAVIEAIEADRRRPVPLIREAEQQTVALLLARALSLRGRADDAERAFAEADALGDDEAVTQAWARHLSRLGRTAEAVERVRERLRSHPGERVTRHVLVEVLCRPGRVGEAIPHLEALFEVDPSRRRAHELMSACQHAHRLAAAQRWASVVIDDDRFGIPLDRSGLEQTSDAWRLLGRSERARLDAERARRAPG